MKNIKGKIINYDGSFDGEIIFEDNIKIINKLSDSKIENYIIPGFIDLHCHGGNGADTMEGIDSIQKMASYHLSQGTTSLLPTTWTSTFEHTFNALNGFKKLINLDNNIFGVHLEGPFINPNKLGAQPPLTQKPSKEFIEKIINIADVKVITLAPEIEGMNEFIPFLEKHKIKIQFGHSLADCNCCKEFMENYNIGFTHLYNAMSGNDHRHPGVLSAALAYGEYAEIICDLKHVSEEAIKIAKKSIKKLYAVTDSIGAAGLKDGDYKFANASITKKDDLITLSDSSTLAGSVISMHNTFLNLLKIKFSIEEAVEMTSYNASKYLNLNDVGIIKEGYKSNFLILDKNYNIKNVYLKGNKIGE